eukprot:16444126-Heterocapsa_arctica.AAC.1
MGTLSGLAHNVLLAELSPMGDADWACLLSGTDGDVDWPCLQSGLRWGHCLGGAQRLACRAVLRAVSGGGADWAVHNVLLEERSPVGTQSGPACRAVSARDVDWACLQERSPMWTLTGRRTA